MTVSRSRASWASTLAVLVLLGACATSGHASTPAMSIWAGSIPAVSIGAGDPMLALQPTAPPLLSVATANTTAAISPVSIVPLGTAPPSGPTLPQPQPIPPDGEEPYTQIGMIEIPAIKLNTPLGEGVTITNIDKGAEHWPGTAMPGQLGNVVVGGHRVSHTHPFLDLDKLNPGDKVIFAVPTGTYTYAVTSTEIVSSDAIEIINQTNAYTATLFACHPKGEVTQRIVVHLTLAQPPG